MIRYTFPALKCRAKIIRRYATSISIIRRYATSASLIESDDMHFLTIILLLIPWSIAFTQSPDNWIKLEPKDAGFSVMMPAKPIEQVSQNEKLTAHAYIAQLDTALYVANYGDYAASMKVSPDEELPAGRDSFNKNLKATLVNSRNISLGGVPGIEFTSETPGATIRSKIFVKDHRTFQIAAVVPKNVDHAKTVQTFLDSFEFPKISN
ncbi:MAG TPA: hypothetical protein VI306_20785 [Pyrinomonadaceae bacterium]